MSPRLLVYDVMDDLAAFKNAPPVMKTQHRAALAAADLVFTGGPSLHRGVLTHRSGDVHLFRSGVDLEHYARAARQRRPAGRRVAGYVGVLDERIDFGLVAQLAAELPDWDIELVGPVHSKIKDVVLPEATHLHYRGFASYDELPEIMALFDVAIMPFARNEATRSISPTKTMEYFAAGLPVVSTPIRDVVDDYGHVVRVAETADAFAAACRAAVDSPPGAALRPADTVLAEGSWDVIVSRMRALVDAKLRAPTAGR
jgi:glycosyltransferase involved in cell wall biosynthesis